jgi:hypothetical protein
MLVKATVQARLDEEARKTMERLVRQLGWTPSEVVREGVRLLAASHPAAGAPRVIGLGKFASGIRRLGSNKKHLEGFGR